MNEKYDVIVVGGGLAGLHVAKNLYGLKVLLIEVKKHPYQHIACAEWVPRLKEFKPYAVTTVEYMELFYEGEKKAIRSPGFIMDREKYQRDMLFSLKDVDIHLGERVVAVEQHRVITDHGYYEGDIIIGADGPFSVFFRNNPEVFDSYLAAINARVPLKKKSKNTLVYFDRRFRFGYAWCFPRGDEANCGVGAYRTNLKELLHVWVRMLYEKGIVENRVYNVRTGAIPLNPLRLPRHLYHVPVGDAGGFIDPLTGAGIAFAIESARSVSNAVKEGKDLNKYREELLNSYTSRFLNRRLLKRKVMEEKWKNLKEAVEESWISSFRV